MLAIQIVEDIWHSEPAAWQDGLWPFKVAGWHKDGGWLNKTIYYYKWWLPFGIRELALGIPELAVDIPELTFGVPELL